MKFQKFLSIVFVTVLFGCAPVAVAPTKTSAPLATETFVPIETPLPTASPTITPIPQTETKLLKDTFLFPCDSNPANVIPLQKDTPLKLLGNYGEMAVVTAYAATSEACGLVALTSLENRPSNSVSPDFFAASEPINAIPLFKSSEDYPRLLVKSDGKLIIDNTVESDTKDGAFLALIMMSQFPQKIHLLLLFVLTPKIHPAS